MINVKGVYITLDNIKTVRFETKGFANVCWCSLVIEYFFDNEFTYIEVDNQEEFYVFADMIMNAVNTMNKIKVN